MNQSSISSTTQLVGLVGWPVSHSVSPAMQNAAFAAQGLDWRYVPLPVEPGRVAEAIRGIGALGLRGVNVTVPHKQAVMEALDRLTPAARIIGAVNTIQVLEDGALLGDNTDARGLVADLSDHGVPIKGCNVLLLGAGGSARAAVYGLAEAGAHSIAILNRTQDRAAELIDAMAPAFPKCHLASYAYPADLAIPAERADLIVNCTSLGMAPHVAGLPWNTDVPLRQAQIVYDLVYNPRQTRLLQLAEAAGAQAIGGIGMLIWQGALAFELWTDQPAPVDVMRAAALDAFAQRSA